MTGFARTEGHDAETTWAWEIKSVNARALDIRCRVPPGYDALETQARRLIPQNIRRGNVAVTLQITRSGTGALPQVNKEALARILEIAREVAGDFAPPRLDGLLRLPGVLEAAPENAEASREREEALARDLAACLEVLVTARRAEGNHLATILSEHLDAIARLTEEADAAPAAQPEAMRERLRGMIALLVDSPTPLPEERIAQEVALLLSKADVREEIDRLRAHVAAARTLLAEGGAIGRRLDFLCQEFNREANTLCSKSSDVDLTQTGLALKAAVEQLREQVQNVE